ncbi:hypothetical protein JKP88DRAFT_301006 [Tribonema minus]|uniref:Uncharacterized protein n=1 Tax=Tribonema minus TaxID=303371 RepID=A0A836CLD7_9STRA|nr:hypothetical protein JKP88DRAFT_301006 [Tribonema minus]
MTIAPRGSSSSSKSKRQHRETSLPLLPEEVVGEILAFYDSHQHWLRFRLVMCELDLNAFELRAGQFSDHDGMLYPSLIMQIVRFDDRRACPIQLATAVAARADRVRAGCKHGVAYTMLGHQGVVVELQRLAPTPCDAIPFPVNDYLPRPLRGRSLMQLAQVWRGTYKADLYWEMYDEHDYGEFTWPSLRTRSALHNGPLLSPETVNEELMRFMGAATTGIICKWVFSPKQAT